MAKKAIYHTFGGKKYKVIFEYPSKMGDADGKCDDPTSKGKTIKISMGLDPERELEVLIHETLHIFDWRCDEEYIERMGKDISSFLYKLGYRKQE